MSYLLSIERLVEGYVVYFCNNVLHFVLEKFIELIAKSLIIDFIWILYSFVSLTLSIYDFEDLSRIVATFGDFI